MPALSAPPMQLYEPINRLKAVAPDIWIVDGPVEWMASLRFKFPFPTRMTIIRLASGELFVHSPTALVPSLQTAVAELGPVAHLVSPNYLHYAHIAAWSKAFPQAQTWSSPGVMQRARRKGVSVAFTRDLTDVAPNDWRADIEQTVVRGSSVLEEIVFFHKNSRTLILADLIENFERSKLRSPFNWLVTLAGAVDPDGKAPIDLRWTFLGGKRRARAGVRRMLSWQPERVILSHGRWYSSHGVEELERAFRWLL